MHNHFAVKTRNRWPDLAMAVMLLALAVAFFWKIALANLILVGVDVFTYFTPFKAYAAEVLRAGRLPLWNPYLFMGVPFLANVQTAALYPLNLPLIWLSTPKMVAYSIVLHIFLGGLFAYLYARLSLGLSPFGALVTAIVFAFSGFLGARVEHLTHLNVYVWLPLLFLLFDLARLSPSLVGRGPGGGTSQSLVGRGLEGGSRPFLPALAGLALAIALQFTAGHLQASYINLFALGLYALLGNLRLGGSQGLAADRQIRYPIAGSGDPAGASWDLPRLAKALGRNLFVYVLAVGLGAALAAVQLLPSYELSRLSIRSGGLPYREAASFSLRPHLILYSLLPTFGEDLGQVFGGESFSEYVGYVGVLALLLALAGILGQWCRHRTLFFVFLGALGLFLALGLANPAYFIFYKLVPGFSLFRAPARWLYLYTTSVAVLAGLGADFLVHSLPEKARIAGYTDAQGLARWLMCRILAALCIPAALVALLSPVLDFPQLPTLMAWALLSCAGLGLILIGLSPWGGRLVFRLTVVLLIVGELFAASRSLAYNNPTAPEAFSSLRTAPAHLLTDRSLYRFISMSGIVYDPGDLKEIQQIFEGQLPPRAIYDYVVAAKRKEILAPNLPLLYKIASVDGYDGGLLPLKRYITLLRLFLPEEDTLPDGRLREQLRQVPEGRLLSLLNVKYILTDKVFDVWIDGVYYDLEHTATLSKGTTPEVMVQDLPQFAATSLGLVSYLEGAEGLADGTPVVEVIVCDTGGHTQRHLLRAGLDTAEGDYDAVAATRPIQHARARIGHHWRDHPGGNDYIALVDLGEATALKEITLRYLAKTGQFHLRGLSLIDERTGTSESVVVSTSGRFKLVHSGDVKIYQNLDVLPRAFVVHRVRVIEDDEAAVAAMRDASFRPDEEAILAEAPPGQGARGQSVPKACLSSLRAQRSNLPGSETHEIASSLSLLAMTEAPMGFTAPDLTLAWRALSGSVEPVSPRGNLNLDQVTVVSYEPERVIIEADLASEGYLILTDTFYPGWRARVDGKESSILRANLLFRALRLSAGQHRVEFSYEPTCLKIGAAVSAVTLLAIVIGLVLVRRR
jgi:hypothetical protein